MIGGTIPGLEGTLLQVHCWRPIRNISQDVESSGLTGLAPRVARVRTNPTCAGHYKINP